ncbi:uncharacterized protein LOC135236807 [Anguilla rostrata]|uniref:Uncharacterized protein n=1 Tax=Anguilla anguilla TaxID=7936 RepID=A0A9D3M341_ANGAN|nr:uncharacterized protein LOC118209318 [Anguilla anguilla]KAG5837683.1 hypothetical protein ANANG_G00242040 [Anguilla anguilla]
MGSGRGLARVIMEMRNEIKKLESENKALRGELELPPSGRETVGPSSVPPAFPHRHAAEETPSHANLRRNASAPTLERQYKENIIMTVRRYSISPNMRTVNRKSEKLTCGLDNAGVEARDTVDGHYSDWTTLQEENRGNAPALLDPASRDDSSISPKEKLTNRRSLQEYVHKNRAKVKTVTFLLPVEDIYTNRPFLANHRPDRNTYDLGVIVEKDS